MSDKRREVEELRQEISKLDVQAVALLDKRAHLSKRIGELRKGQPASMPANESAIVDHAIAKSNGDMPEAALRAVFREIQANCLSLEMPASIAFVGADGGAGHAAAQSRFGAPALYVAADSAAAALEEVSRHRADLAVVPFETRADGPVQATISALAASELRIVSCFEVAQNLQLVSRTGNVADIEKVYATAADHALCHKALAHEVPRARVLDVKTPLLACQFAVEDHGAGALAMEPFAVELGLSVAKRNVRDDGDDRIRYAVVGTRPSSRTGRDLTAIVVSAADSPGALHELLKQFAERGINLTKIQSRPAPGEAWTYLFYIEASGHATDRTIVAALEDVKRLAKSFRLLGSYAEP